MQWILCNAVAILCVACATVTAIYQLDGWGWFLVVGFFAITVPVPGEGQNK